VIVLRRLLYVAGVALAALALIALCFMPGCKRGTSERRVTRSQAASNATYYVSPSGSNSNPGTKEDPWATPGYGSKKLKPGDTLVILGGRYSLKTYWDDMITPPTGADGAWITIKGEAGNRPVLAGRDDLFSAVDISNTSYIRIENLEITSDNGAKFRGGVEATGGPVNHIVLEDLYIHHIDDFGVNIGDTVDFQIIDCDITYCAGGAVGGPAGKHGGIRNLLVSGCNLSYCGHYYQGNPGPGPYDRPDGFGIEPSEGPIEIRDTTAEHNLGDGLDSKAANTYIHECVVANNTCDGVKLWAHDSKIENTVIYGTGDGADSQWVGIVVEDQNTPNARFEIVNVTLHDNPSRQAYPMTVQYDMSNPIALLMRNTIVANGHGEAYFGDSVKLTADHNIFYRPGEEVQVHANGRDYTAAQLEAGELGPGNLCADPKFVRPAWGETGDYHLRQDSPAIDAGASEGAPSIDLDGNARPHGKGYDIGAYEFGASKPPMTTWYLPEGCTAGGFETWVLLQNPGEDRASAEITYMTPSGEIGGPTLILEPLSRQTVNVSDTVPDAWSVSTMVSSDRPVVAERATYWADRTGGHSSVGVTVPSQTWYLAEGCTAGGFETWVLLQNPGEERASAKLTFMTPAGEVEGPTVSLEARTRQTVNVADTVPKTTSVSTEVTSDKPVIAERAVYWKDRAAGHDSIGVTSPSQTWYLAEGCTAGGFETWVLLQNPSDEKASAKVTYMTPQGEVSGPTANLEPGTRQTLNAANTVPDKWSVSTEVTSDKPIIAERATYWGDRSGGHDSIGVVNPSALWYLAEGCTAGGFETWVLVQNPGEDRAIAKITYMTPTGEANGPTVDLGPRTRETVNVADTVPNTWSVSTKVSSDKPVVVERATYWAGRTRDGTASIGFAP
jgi:hypothetical protein